MTTLQATTVSVVNMNETDVTIADPATTPQKLHDIEGDINEIFYGLCMFGINTTDVDNPDEQKQNASGDLTPYGDIISTITDFHDSVKEYKQSWAEAKSGDGTALHTSLEDALKELLSQPPNPSIVSVDTAKVKDWINYNELSDSQNHFGWQVWSEQQLTELLEGARTSGFFGNNFELCLPDGDAIQLPIKLIASNSKAEQTNAIKFKQKSFAGELSADTGGLYINAGVGMLCFNNQASAMIVSVDVQVAFNTTEIIVGSVGGNQSVSSHSNSIEEAVSGFFDNNYYNADQNVVIQRLGNSNTADNYDSGNADHVLMVGAALAVNGNFTQIPHSQYDSELQKSLILTPVYLLKSEIDATFKAHIYAEDVAAWIETTPVYDETTALNDLKGQVYLADRKVMTNASASPIVQTELQYALSSLLIGRKTESQVVPYYAA